MHVFLVYRSYNHLVIIMQTLESSKLISSVDSLTESPHEVLRTVNPYKPIFSANLKTFGEPLQKIVHNTNNSELYDSYTVTSQGYSYVPKSKFLVKSNGSSLTGIDKNTNCSSFNHKDFLNNTQSFYIDPVNAYKMSWTTGGTTFKDTDGYIGINDKVYVGYSPEKTIVSALVKIGSDSKSINSMFNHREINKGVDANNNISLSCYNSNQIGIKIGDNIENTNFIHNNTLLMTMMNGKSLFFGTPKSELENDIHTWINDLDSDYDSDEIKNISSNNFVVDQTAKIIQGINVVLDNNANVLCCLTTLATGEIESNGSTNEIRSGSETKTMVLPVDNKIESSDYGGNDNNDITYHKTPVSYNSVDPSKVSMYTVNYPTDISGAESISPLDNTLLFSKKYTSGFLTTVSGNIIPTNNNIKQQYKYFVFNYTAPATVLLDSHILYVFNRSVDLAIGGLDNYGLIYIQFDFKIMDKSTVKTTVTLKARKINYNVEYVKGQDLNIVKTGDFKKGDTKSKPYLPSDYLKDIATNAPLKGYSVYNKVDEGSTTNLKKMYRPVGLYKENKYYEGHYDTANTNVKSANIIPEAGFINIDCKDRAIYNIDSELKEGKVNYQCGTKPVNNLTRHASVAYSGYYPGAYDPKKASTLNKKTDNYEITDASADTYFMPLERRNTLTFECPDNKVLTSLFTFDKLKHGLIEHRTEYTCGTYL